MAQYALAAAAAATVKLEGGLHSPIAPSAPASLPPGHGHGHGHGHGPGGLPLPPLSAAMAGSGGGGLPPPPPPSSTSSTAGGAAGGFPAGVQHKRVYQACIPCRRRKVRCDLGSVDNPNDPPCVRCRRESKDCYFSATRRKRKTDDDGNGAGTGTGPDSDYERDEYIIRNGRKRVHTGGGVVAAGEPLLVDDAPESPATSQTTYLDRRGYSDVPLTPGGSQGRTQPLRRPLGGPAGVAGSQGSPTDRMSATASTVGSSTRRSGTATAGNGGGDFGGPGDEPNAQLENYEARTVMRREVYGPHDALDLLYKAATDSKRDDDPRNHHHGHHGSVASQASQRSAAGAVVGMNVVDPALQGRAGNMMMSGPKLGRDPRDRTAPMSVRPAAGGGAGTGGAGAGAGASAAAGGGAGPSVAAAPAAVDLSDQNIDPELTRRDPSSEPGYAEALKAWTRFRFVRAGWFTAQEAVEYIDYYYTFLSPLTPISPPTFQNPSSHLTLLTEEPILTVTLLTIASRYKQIPGAGGHCRSHAIHEQLWTYLRGMIERCLWGQEAFGGGFCGSGADESQTSSTAPWRGLRKGSLRTLGTIESLMILTEWHPRALHFPPAEATDELMLPSYDDPRDGVFIDEDGNQRPTVGGRRIESWLEPAWRSDRMCWMLLSTAMGLAYELGVFDDIDELLATGAIARPEYEEETYRLRAFRIKRLLLIYLTQLAGRLGWTNMVPESLRKTDPAVSRKRPTSVEDLELDDQIIHCWAGISNAMHIGNEKLFRSRKHTTEIIQNSKYISLLKEFQPMLREWWKEFERFRLPLYIRHILTIEYEYVRIYINSLSLQAVVERCTSNAGQGVNQGAGGAGGSAAGNPAQLSPQTQNYYGKLPLGQLGGFGPEDQEYVREVVEGSRNLLRTVVEGLLPGDYLKHAPVRTYFRIISGAMFLLKTFALGAPKSEVWASISLMDQTVNALRTCVVDDVHLGIRFADLLESLTSRLRNRFIQASASNSLPGGNNAANSADGRSPNPSHQLADNAGAGNAVPTVAVTNGSNGVGSGAAGGGGGGGAATAASMLPANGAAPGLGGNGNGVHHDQLGLPEQNIWNSKMREAMNGLDRSATPVNANISATPFDLSGNNFPYISGGNGAGAGSGSVLGGPATPAASSNMAGPADGNNMAEGMFEEWGSAGNEMWYLPPGPAFFQNMENSAVAMTAEGVNVGGMDLLEYMAMDQFPLDSNTY